MKPVSSELVFEMINDPRTITEDYNGGKMKEIAIRKKFRKNEIYNSQKNQNLFVMIFSRYAVGQSPNSRKQSLVMVVVRTIISFSMRSRIIHRCIYIYMCVINGLLSIIVFRQWSMVEFVWNQHKKTNQWC